MQYVFVVMASLQLEGRYLCLCCARPFHRRGDLLRHLTSSRLKGDHEEYYSVSSNAERLKTSSGFDWQAIREAPTGCRSTADAGIFGRYDRSGDFTASTLQMFLRARG
jgi:hypothetical protein